MTSDVLKEIMLCHNMSDHFLDIVSSFYNRSLGVEEAFAIPYQRFTQRDHDGIAAILVKKSRLTTFVELMYVLKYPELNGRSTTEPWSIRQSAIYHQMDRANLRSTIILVSSQPETIARDRLMRWLNNASSLETVRTQAATPHILLLSAHTCG